MHRTWGGTVSGTLFVLPGVVSSGILSALYAAYGQLGLVAAIFFSLKAFPLIILITSLIGYLGQHFGSPWFEPGQHTAHPQSVPPGHCFRAAQKGPRK
jgi:chromate transport protein ChrA